jgi:hypothetical protein
MQMLCMCPQTLKADGSREAGVEQESGEKVTDKDELQRLKVSLEAVMAAGRRPLSRSASKRPEVVPRQEVKNEILLKIKGNNPQSPARDQS